MRRWAVWLLFAVGLAQLAPANFCLCWVLPCNGATQTESATCAHDNHAAEKCPCHHDDEDSPCPQKQDPSSRSCPFFHISATDVILVRERHDASQDYCLRADQPVDFLPVNSPDTHFVVLKANRAGPPLPLYLCFRSIII